MQWWHAQRLKSNNPKTRRAAVEKLAEHPSADAFALLAPVLQDSDPEVRKSAARALGRLREPKAIPYLLHSLQDPVSEVRAGNPAAQQAAARRETHRLEITVEPPRQQKEHERVTETK